MKNETNLQLSVLLAASIGLSAFGLLAHLLSAAPVFAGSSFSSSTTPSYPNAQPTPTVQQPPQTFEPPPFSPPPVHQIPTLPVFSQPYRPPIVVPTDVTSANPNLTANNFGVGNPTDGVMTTKSFPSMEQLSGNPDFILVNGDENNYRRESPYLVNLMNGTVLISVHRPSSLGMLTTPLGQVSFSANSDAFVAYENGVLRIRNVDGLNQAVKVHLDKGPFAGENAHAYTLAPGYELVLSDHKLNANEMRPQDGIMRRQSKAIDAGYGAISQYHVQTALQASALIPKMVAAESDAKIKRVLGDMSRMAAVLNHVNGGDGYSQ